ncbi:MAG: IclR family transcriptional regulator [Lawsonibacter sp.]|nr:IclR family transcriptional regulator [Lawsonibacter sp.]
MDPQNTTVPALERALNILEYLSTSEQPVSLKTLSGELNIPTASAFRLMKNLTNRGYVVEHTGGQVTYALGEQVTMLAMAGQRGNSLWAKAVPLMRTLSNSLGQTSQLAVMKQGTLMYIGQRLPDEPNKVNVLAPLYTPLNIHTSAGGKVLFSYLNEKEQIKCLKSMSFQQATPKTITDPIKFREMAACVRAQGYGLDDEEYAIGIGCLAVPVFQQDQCIAALGITGSITAYHDQEEAARMLRALQKSAEALSRTLAFC